MATGYVSGDPQKVDVAGDTMTGPLVLVDGSPAASEEYVAEHGGGGGGAVASVFGRTGVVVATSGDYTPGQVGADPAGAAAAAVAAHEADTTNVHGITNTAALETTTGSAAKVTAHTGATDPHGDRGYADAQLATKADLVGGVIPTAQLPALAVTEYLGSVASQAAMLALVGQKGDWAIRSDLGTTWVITGSDPTQLASWTQLSYPTAPVLTVNGQTGAVTLAAADVGAAPTSRTLTAGTGLTGGGDLTANRTFAVAYGSSAGTAAEGNDSRITGAVPSSTVDAKGDILAGTADNAVGRLAVGTSVDHLLVPAAAAASGLAWEARDRVPDHAARFGLKVLTIPAAAVEDSFNAGSGNALYVLVRVPAPITITKLGAWITVAGVTGSGDNTMAVYSEAGTRLGITGDMTTPLSSTGWAEGDLTASLDLVAGSYYLSLLTHFSGTVPKVAATASTSFNRIGLLGHLPTIFATSQTSHPGSITPGSLTVNTVEYFFGAR